MKAMRFLLFLLLALPALQAAAQVQVTVSVMPPYTGQLKDYVMSGTNVLITLTNQGTQQLKLKLIPSLTGNNGVKASVKEDFMPAVPVILNPGETKLLTGNKLKFHNSNLSDGDILRQGISDQQVLQTGNLPEGIYQLCIKALPYEPAPGMPLGYSGCAMVNIQQYDPPIVMNPINDSKVKPQNPQLIPFSWTPSGPIGKTSTASASWI